MITQEKPTKQEKPIKPQKPFYKLVWFWLFVVAMVLYSVSSAAQQLPTTEPPTTVYATMPTREPPTIGTLEVSAAIQSASRLLELTDTYVVAYDVDEDTRYIHILLRTTLEQYQRAADTALQNIGLACATSNGNTAKPKQTGYYGGLFDEYNVRVVLYDKDGKEKISQFISAGKHDPIEPTK